MNTSKYYEGVIKAPAQTNRNNLGFRNISEYKNEYIILKIDNKLIKTNILKIYPVFFDNTTQTLSFTSNIYFDSTEDNLYFFSFDKIDFSNSILKFKQPSFSLLFINGILINNYYFDFQNFKIIKDTSDGIFFMPDDYIEIFWF